MRLWLSPLVQLANRIVNLDARAQSELAALDGRTIELVVGEARTLDVRLVVSPLGFYVVDRLESAPDVRLSGPPGAYLRALRGDFTGIHADGDLDLAQRLERMFARLEPDWEEALSRVTGDVPAHLAGRAGRAARAFASEVSASAAANLREYLQFERGLLPARVEVERFLDEVDRLRADADRLAARIRRLEEGCD